jgi:hypothetical protein
MAEPTTLKEQAMQMLQSLIVTATEAGDFIKEQMPMVIRELLLFNTAKYAFWTALGLAFLIAAAFWVRFGLKKYRADMAANATKSYHLSDWIPGTILPAIGGTFVGGLLFFDSFFDLLQITLAPRVWLIEYAARLVR